MHRQAARLQICQGSSLLKVVDKSGDPYCNLVDKVHQPILTEGQQLCWPPLSKCHGDSCSDLAPLLPVCLIFNIVLLAKEYVIVQRLLISLTLFVLTLWHAGVMSVSQSEGFHLVMGAGEDPRAGYPHSASDHAMEPTSVLWALHKGRFFFTALLWRQTGERWMGPQLIWFHGRASFLVFCFVKEFVALDPKERRGTCLVCHQNGLPEGWSKCFLVSIHIASAGAESLEPCCFCPHVAPGWADDLSWAGVQRHPP